MPETSRPSSPPARRSRPGARRTARPPWALLRGLAAAGVALALLGTGLTSTSAGDLQGQIDSARSAASSLQSQIAAETKKIAATTGGLNAAKTQLSQVQSELDQRVAQLKSVQDSLLAARNHLVDLENRLHVASQALGANLVANYEGQPPDLVSVVLNSHGFGDLLNRMSFMARIARQNSTVVGVTRSARAEVARQANGLATLEDKDRSLANEILTKRNQAAALQAALLNEQVREMRARSHTNANYQSVNGHLKALEKQAAEQAARAAQQATQAAATGNANVGGIAVNTGGMVHAPPGAPAAISQIIAAGNAIATLPYIYGGGHASFHANGYDCSGSVSYALAAAGLVSSPMVSGDFENWGAPGPGRWITIYANADHVWMQVAGWRFDTVALAEGGTRWAQGGGEFSSFVVRHPPGL